jgi:hypothetical protein
MLRPYCKFTTTGIETRHLILNDHTSDQSLVQSVLKARTRQKYSPLTSITSGVNVVDIVSPVIVGSKKSWSNPISIS